MSLGRDHRWPPSWVIHRAGPKANPSVAVANRNRRIPSTDASDISGAAGAATRSQLAPPVVVRAIVVHGSAGQVASPNTHPVSLDTNVTLSTKNPPGAPLPAALAAGPVDPDAALDDNDPEEIGAPRAGRWSVQLASAISRTVTQTARTLSVPDIQTPYDGNRNVPIPSLSGTVTQA